MAKVYIWECHHSESVRFFFGHLLQGPAAQAAFNRTVGDLQTDLPQGQPECQCLHGKQCVVSVGTKVSRAMVAASLCIRYHHLGGLPQPGSLPTVPN